MTNTMLGHAVLLCLHFKTVLCIVKKNKHIQTVALEQNIENKGPQKAFIFF